MSDLKLADFLPKTQKPRLNFSITSSIKNNIRRSNPSIDKNFSSIRNENENESIKNTFDKTVKKKPQSSGIKYILNHLLEKSALFH